MMIELPDLPPFDLEGDWLENLVAERMVGAPDELYTGGMPRWKQSPGELGPGLSAFIRMVKPLADETPKIPGAAFLERLQAQGMETDEIRIMPAALLHDASISDEAADDE